MVFYVSKKQPQLNISGILYFPLFFPSVHSLCYIFAMISNVAVVLWMAYLILFFRGGVGFFSYTGTSDQLINGILLFNKDVIIDLVMLSVRRCLLNIMEGSSSVRSL